MLEYTFFVFFFKGGRHNKVTFRFVSNCTKRTDRKSGFYLFVPIMMSIYTRNSKAEVSRHESERERQRQRKRLSYRLYDMVFFLCAISV